MVEHSTLELEVFAEEGHLLRLAFLALERACGGKAVESLKFLDETEPVRLDVQGILEEYEGPSEL